MTTHQRVLCYASSPLNVKHIQIVREAFPCIAVSLLESVKDVLIGSSSKIDLLIRFVVS